MSQIERIIKILELLSMNRKLSTEDLHRHFNRQISLRTIQRDIKSIESAGIPLLMEKNIDGKNYWYFSRDYKKMVLPTIQPNELFATYILKSYLRTFKGTRVEQDLNSVIDKLETIAPGEVYLNIVGEQSVLWNQDFGDFDYQDYAKILDKIIAAITQKKWCAVNYSSLRSKEKSLIIFVHKLFTFNGGIYLAVTAEGYEDYITLSLQRIQSIEFQLKQRAEVPTFDLNKFRHNRFAVFSGKPVPVELLIDKDVAHYFANRQWHPSQKLFNQKDGRLLLQMKVPITHELIGWVLSWHSLMEVRSPTELIEQIKSRLDAMIELYKSR